MMAVAALSLAVQEGKERLDALQHYQQALPALQSSLKSPNDLSSDGAFLTHFLLLLYEVGAGNHSLGGKTFADHGIRLPQRRMGMPTSGRRICRPFYGLLCYGARFLVEKDFRLLFGGFATLIWTPSSVAPGAENMLDIC